MEKNELYKFYNRFKYGEDIFHRLMPVKIREILLVSTFYDAFIFEEDGRFSEQIFGEYHQLNLTSAPRITSVPTGKEALKMLADKDFDMVITMMHIGEVTPFELARESKKIKPNTPILLLLNVQSDVSLIDKTAPEMEFIDNVFLWSGDSKVFLAMIKYVEDRLNVAHDTDVGLVRVILLVEDSIFYYSRFLPELCKEVMLQVQRLLSEGLNDIQKNYRMRTRPKILMAHNFEDAVQICEKYRDYLLCVISDIGFAHNGEHDDRAGIELTNFLKNSGFDIPILIQSSQAEMAEEAKNLDVGFINKYSPTLLQELGDFIHYNLGFGDFVFRNENGEEYAKASTMHQFESLLEEIPDDVLIHHSKRNDFSRWLIAHGEIEVAKRIKPLKVADFENSSEIRDFLIEVFQEVRSSRTRGRIVDFEKSNLNIDEEITRLSQGSLGGKGRGIAFLNALLNTLEFDEKFPDVDIRIPRTAFIGTHEYDRFIRDNNLCVGAVGQDGNSCTIDDSKVKELFVDGKISDELHRKLESYLKHINEPIAVRSSGLLEDSLAQPFAGIYETYMLPNTNSDFKKRLENLETAIKLVFASTCLNDARGYTERIHYRTEEEKMAVIIQAVAGRRHADYYYPHISGVAQSYNYYPTSYVKNTDGVASIALGLGGWVVSGKNVFRFCPKYPKIDILPPEDIVQNSQREFYAIDMASDDFDLMKGEESTYAVLDLETAEEHGSLQFLASVWDVQDKRLRDGIDEQGPRVLNFSYILKHSYIPLAEILDELLEIGEVAFGVPVEIEFAADLPEKPDGKALFYILQIRPLSVHSDRILTVPEEIDHDKLWLYTNQGMGNGVIENLRDVIFIDPEKFDKTKTMDMLVEIKQLNEKMRKAGREYILIGPGRWGSRDRLLGVPVRWSDINLARVVVETGIEGYAVDPSQGTHFFHNLVSMNAGYFNVPHKSEDGFIDWDWLKNLPTVEVSEYFIHVSRENPFIVKMFGQAGVATIEK